MVYCLYEEDQKNEKYSAKTAPSGIVPPDVLVVSFQRSQ